jgi:hypothetical protein
MSSASRDLGNKYQMKISMEKPDDALGIEDTFGDCCSIVVCNSEFCHYNKEYFIDNLNILYLGDDGIKFQKSYNNKKDFCLLFNPKVLYCSFLEKLTPFVELGYYDIDFEMESQLQNYFNRICSEVLSDYRYRKELAENLLFELGHYIVRNIILPKY